MVRVVFARKGVGIRRDVEFARQYFENRAHVFRVRVETPAQGREKHSSRRGSEPRLERDEW